MTAPNVCKDEAFREEGKKQDGLKFHTPVYIKVTPVSAASKGRNGKCSFLQLRVCMWRGFLGERTGEVNATNYVLGDLYKKTMTMRTTLSAIARSTPIHDSRVRTEM